MRAAHLANAGKPVVCEWFSVQAALVFLQHILVCIARWLWNPARDFV